jgi:hypothetical protein
MDKLTTQLTNQMAKLRMTKDVDYNEISSPSSSSRSTSVESLKLPDITPIKRPGKGKKIQDKPKNICDGCGHGLLYELLNFCNCSNLCLTCFKKHVVKDEKCLTKAIVKVIQTGKWKTTKWQPLEYLIPIVTDDGIHFQVNPTVIKPTRRPVVKPKVKKLDLE